MRILRCLACGRACGDVFRHVADGVILRCGACGLAFVHPQPSDVNALYRSEGMSPAGYYRRCAPADRRTFSLVLDRVSPFVQGRRVLDVGCATGTFLEVARDRGFEVFGVELSPESLAWCRSRGLPVAAGPVESADFPEAHFDLIHLGDVLEHLTDPAETLRFLRGLLRKEGVIVVSTPNFAALAARVFQIKPREHLFYFTARSLAQLLEHTGFRPLTIRPFDRWREIGSLAFSTTFPPGSRLGKMLSVLHAAQAGLPLIVRFPFRENVLAFARMVV